MLGPMLFLSIDTKLCMESPLAPLHLTVSHLKRSRLFVFFKFNFIIYLFIYFLQFFALLDCVSRAFVVAQASVVRRMRYAFSQKLARELMPNFVEL